MTRLVVGRALLVALSLAALVPVAIPVLGAFLPGPPLIGPFGLFVIEDLHGIAALAVVGLVLSLAAFRLGGGRPAKAALGLSVILVVGIAAIASQLDLLANAHGFSFDLIRQASPVSATRAPNEHSVYWTTPDGQDLFVEVWWANDNAPNAFGAFGSGIGGTAGPAVLFLHGGGFWGGELRSRPALFQVLADKGYTVYDADYRVSPPPRWDQAPVDALCALAYVDGVQARLGADPGKVVVIGESAGGNLALMAVYAAGTDKIPTDCGPITKPAGVIAISPTVDLDGIWRDGSLSKDGQRFPEAYVGGVPDQFPDRYAAASPLGLVRADVPATLMLIAANDHLVHPNRSTDLIDALEAAGASYELVVVPFADHGFDGPPNAFGQQLEDSLFPAFIAAHT